MSKLMKKKLNISQAEEAKRNLLVFNSKGMVGLDDGIALRVLGKVLEISSRFVEEYDPECVVFLAVGKSRINVYRRMVQRMFPKANLQTEATGQDAVEFYLC